MSLPNKKVLTLFGLTMINIIAVDNLRGLSMGAEYGLGLISLYGLVSLCFFVPSALVASELATAWPNTGGIYVWVREAFGPATGFFVIWLQWIYNVFWYPTLTIFIAGILAHFVAPPLIESKLYMVVTTLFIFWATTFMNCYGMRLSSWVSNVGALLGTLFPMLFIILLGTICLLQGHPTQIDFTTHDLIPKMTHWGDISFLSAIVFGFMGIEMSAAHGGEVVNPEKNFSRAILISAVIIILSLVLASLSIAVVVPYDQLNIITGLMQGFALFFEHFHMPWFNGVLSLLIVMGSLSSMAAWVIGPTKGLMVAGQDGSLPACLSKQNSRGVPINLLLLQAFIVTALCASFLVLPTVSSSYWYLTDLTAQMALISYLFFFVAAVRLRYVRPNVRRYFRVPGGRLGIWICSGLGIFSCLFAMLVGFIPPHQIDVGSGWQFDGLLLVGILLFTVPACLVAYWRKYLPF